MKKKDWVLIFIVFVVSILIDQLTKSNSHFFNKQTFGFFNVLISTNKGLFLGAFPELPSFVRVVLFATFAFFLLSVYAFIQFIIPDRLFYLRFGLTLMISGILGNVIDLINYGYVIDFLFIKILDHQTAIWNLADLIQWVGCVFILYFLIKDHKKIWPENDSRSKLWVDSKFQIKQSIILIASSLLTSLICMIFSYSYLRVTLKTLGIDDKISLNSYTNPLLYSFVFLFLTIAIGQFIFSRYVSHKIAGPIFAFERYINNLVNENDDHLNSKNFKLRKSDDLKNLEKLALTISEKIRDLKKSSS